MSVVLNLKPSSKVITIYYAALDAYARQRVKHEGALRSAFQNLLTEVGKGVGWTLIPELSGASIRPDGTFRDAYYLERGYWEAKDTQDKLEAEIKKKIAKEYPLTNAIFEDTRQAYLYQNGDVVIEADLTQPQQLITLLIAFFSYTAPAHEDFNKAVADFQHRAPDLARRLVEKLTDAHKNNARFIKAFDGFHTLCKTSLADAEKKLAHLHLDYEKIEPYPLQWIETPGVPLSYRVEKMRLNKDKASLQVSDSLTLAGIPPETFLYRLGNRSALEWIIDQYQVSEDKRSGIKSDPNRSDDEEYIVRLVGQVVRVSVETVSVIQHLPTNWVESSDDVKGKTMS